MSTMRLLGVIGLLAWTGTVSAQSTQPTPVLPLLNVPQSVPGLTVMEPTSVVPNAFDTWILPHSIRPGLPTPGQYGGPLPVQGEEAPEGLFPYNYILQDPLADRPSLQAPPARNQAAPGTSKAPGPSKTPPASGMGWRHPRKPNPYSIHAVFKDPARFPLYRYGLSGEVQEAESAVIYEGMSLGVTPQGYYELRFMVQAPRTPVTIRLQLAVHEGSTTLGTITLPPFTLLPENHKGLDGLNDLPPAVPTKSWQIRHVGYSHVLVGMTPDLAGDFSVTRQGTARFGSLPTSN